MHMSHKCFYVTIIMKLGLLVFVGVNLLSVLEGPWHLVHSGKELWGLEGKWCWSYSMQAGLGDASATAHRAAELPSVLGVLQAEEHCNSHTIPAQLSLSCIHCPAASTASPREWGKAPGSSGL